MEKLRKPRMLITLAVLLTTFGCVPGSAGAAQIRLFQEDFGSAAKPTFGSPKGMAVDPSSATLLVIDTATKTVSRFDADGTPSTFSALGTNVIDGKTGPDETPSGSILGSALGAREVQVAVDDSGGATDGNIYVTNASVRVIDIFAASGQFLGRLTKFINATAEEKPLGETCGVGVDSNGAVYVSDYSNNLVHKYVPAANPPTSLDNVANFATPKPCTLAAGFGPSSGLLFVTNFNSGSLAKLDAGSGAKICDVDPGLQTETFPDIVATAAVNPVTGNLFVADGKEAVEYDASGGAGEPCATEVSVAKAASTVEGVAPEIAGNRLYLTRAGKAQVEVYGAPAPPPAVTTEPASSIGETSATLNGTVDPEGVEVSQCRFEYVSDAAYAPGATNPYAAGSTAPCAESPAAIGSGSSPVAVHADVAGLQAGVLYHFRAVAVNPSGTATGEDRTFATQAEPIVEEAWVAGTTHSEATLKAKINPRFYPTTFRVEYGPTATYGQSTGEFAVGSGGTAQTVTAILTGLDPASAYHWRIVATNENGEDESADATFATYAGTTAAEPCPNDAFRYGPSARLPDCRAYEMVSPVDKNGGDAAPVPGSGSGHRRASLDGERITYTSATSFGDSQRGAYANQYLASRATDGWSNHGLHPPQGTTVFDVAGRDLVSRTTLDLGNSFHYFTPDLCFALMIDQNQEPLTADSIHGYTNAYLRDNCGASADSYEAITRGDPPFSSDLEENLWLEARNLTPNRRFTVFSSRAALTGDAAPAESSGNQLYIFDFATEQLRLVSKLPSGAASTANNSVGTGVPRKEATLERAVAQDGSRVFWTVSAGETVSVDGGNLYVRLNAAEEQSAFDGSGNCTEPTKACTVAIHEGLPLAKFWTANQDGSVAIFTAGDELYQYDVGARAKSLIADEAGGVVGASEDLSHLYFTSKEAIVGAGANERGEEAQAGEWNLYVRRGGPVEFIATVAPQDRDSIFSIDSLLPLEHTSRVSPDGRHLAFVSLRSLTGYDNVDQASGEADREVFLYAADTGDLTCVSCNPSGARPRGRNATGGFGSEWTAAWISPWEWSTYAKRSLSDDGDRIFFNAFDALVPEDKNNAQDVYQWEAPETGTCDVGDPNYFVANEGCVDLISSGAGGDSEFVDASANGSDVFFETGASLDPRDPGSVDIYDAREGGGFPLPSPPASPCVGDACQSVPSPPPAKAPTSGTYRGPGDSAQKPRRRCRKGTRLVRKGGKVRCVKKKRRGANRNRRAGR